jgi:predicted transcriptional regulator
MYEKSETEIAVAHVRYDLPPGGRLTPKQIGEGPVEIHFRSATDDRSAVVAAIGDTGTARHSRPDVQSEVVTVLKEELQGFADSRASHFARSVLRVLTEQGASDEYEIAFHSGRSVEDAKVRVRVLEEAGLVRPVSSNGSTVYAVESKDG